jgi:cytochrome c-type biogenesis protein CcmH/NrfF
VRHEAGAAPRRLIEEGPLMARFSDRIQAAPNINTDGIVEWGVQNIIPILLLIVGVGIIASARKGRMSENAMTITNVMLGCVVIAGAAFFYGFADNIANFIFKS